MVETMKHACEQYISASQFIDVLIGTVESIGPYTVRISQKILLDESDLVFTETVLGLMTDEALEEIDTTHNHGSASFNSLHSHMYDGMPTGETELNTSHSHNAAGGTYNLKHTHKTRPLAEGDKVILIRKTGGQQYFVIDRVGVI